MVRRVRVGGCAAADWWWAVLVAEWGVLHLLGGACPVGSVGYIPVRPSVDRGVMYAQGSDGCGGCCGGFGVRGWGGCGWSSRGRGMGGGS